MPPTAAPASFYDFSARRNDGKTEKMSAYKGKAALVVNVASKCGFTPQYEGLERLWRAHKDEGFVVLAFPCNQFGAQEPGDAAEIASFCTLSYDVTFPLFEKVDVNGANAHPMFEWLKKERPGIAGSKSIKWNFTKFLVDREGRVVTRYAPQTAPAALEADVVKALR
ncbi:MAG: glutathione peroxidase [Parvularculaceae bacterium]|nr:glutathione peroxidase [Parvularculaceae bacterium]